MPQPLLDAPIDDHRQILRPKPLQYLEIGLLGYLGLTALCVIFFLGMAVAEDGTLFERSEAGYVLGVFIGLFLFLGPFLGVPYLIWRWRQTTKTYLEDKDPKHLSGFPRRTWGVTATWLLLLWGAAIYQMLLPFDEDWAVAIFLLVVLFPVGPLQFWLMWRSLRALGRVLEVVD